MSEDAVSVERLSALLGISTRQIQRLTAQDALQKTDRGKYPLAANIQSYISFKCDHGETEESRDLLYRDKLSEEVKKLKRENLVAEKQLVPVDHMEMITTKVMQRLSQIIDRLPDIAADACREVDGRGRQRMTDALIEQKNEIARLPQTMLRSVDEL